MTVTRPGAINAAATATAYAYGRARWPVMAELADGTTTRIIRARTVKGVLQVLVLGTGCWMPAARVWRDS